ncbi:MAG: mismatch-specific DNA-glycosylase [Deltaproteobacteria bacterium]|nr:mismatch-specific DNA-glycosylase [Deltaproteobacteria bacterium]
MRLPDIVTPRPRILFVGINPGHRSGQLGHHFAGPGNPFWRLLHASGLTPEVIPAVEDHRLADYGYALTNLAARPTRSAAELRRTELARGRRELIAKIETMRPAVVALVGITLYPLVVGGATPGPGAKPERLAGARVFVVPNPSGLNASFPGFASKLVWFEALAAFARSRATPASRSSARPRRSRGGPSPGPTRRPSSPRRR